jgi:hypothetical protein
LWKNLWIYVEWGAVTLARKKMLLLTGIKFSVSYMKSVILAQNNAYILEVCILCPGNECISSSVSITYRNYNFLRNGTALTKKCTSFM